METLRDRIIRHEGCVLKVYNDSLGVPTIGIGRNLRDNGISQAEADFMLDNDLKAVTQQLDIQFPWTRALDDVRHDVILEMLFQMGAATLRKFVAVQKACERQDYTAAAAAMLESLWAKQTPSRAKELAAIMATGEPQQ